MLNPFTKVDISFDDFRQSARKRLPKLLFEYIDGAASDGSGEADNRKIIRQLRLNTKALINVEKRSLNHKIFRTPSKLPIAAASPALLEHSCARGASLIAQSITSTMFACCFFIARHYIAEPVTISIFDLENM